MEVDIDVGLRVMGIDYRTYYAVDLPGRYVKGYIMVDRLSKQFRTAAEAQAECDRRGDGSRVVNVFPVHPSYTRDPTADFAVLAHIRKTWDVYAFTAFALVLEAQWSGGYCTGFPWTRYKPGDYSRAALATLDARAKSKVVA